MANWYQTAFIGIAVLGFGGAFGVIVWLSRIVPANINKKYAWSVRIKCKFPFVANWEKNIDAEDIGAFRRYRKVFFTWYVVAAILLFLEFLIWQRMIAAAISG